MNRSILLLLKKKMCFKPEREQIKCSKSAKMIWMDFKPVCFVLQCHPLILECKNKSWPHGNVWKTSSEPAEYDNVWSSVPAEYDNVSGKKKMNTRTTMPKMLSF